jgi:hypothetical protein
MGLNPNRVFGASLMAQIVPRMKKGPATRKGPVSWRGNLLLAQEDIGSQIAAACRNSQRQARRTASLRTLDRPGVTLITAALVRYAAP